MSSKVSASYFGKPRSVTRAELQATEIVECPLCGLAPEPFAVDYQGFQLCRCRRCRLEFVSPRLAFEELAEKIYTDSYFSGLGSAAHLSETHKHQFSLQLDSYSRLLGGSGKILDIGCGDGSFLQYARQLGWDIFGVDIALSPDAHSLNCPLWEGRLQEINFGATRFDVIRLNHVLEHTQNPPAELSRARALLEPGGIIHISVPNMAGLSPVLKSIQSRLRLKRHRWRHYAAMHHLFFFSPETLRLVIETAGLRVLYWETPVLKKNGQHPLVERLYRRVLERPHRGSILDFYSKSAPF